MIIKITKTYDVSSWADLSTSVLCDVIRCADMTTLCKVEDWVYSAWPSDYDTITDAISMRRKHFNAREDDALRALGLSDDTLIARQQRHEKTETFIG